MQTKSYVSLLFIEDKNDKRFHPEAWMEMALKCRYSKM